MKVGGRPERSVYILNRVQPYFIKQEKWRPERAIICIKETN
jgi:hypothetical protein